ncbi:hypothetical protein ABTK85_19810, partial [Acinetobacter baumannii]
IAASGQDDAAAHARHLAQTFTRLANGPEALRDRAGETLSVPLGVMLDSARALLQASEVNRQTLPDEIRADWLAPDGRARVDVFPKG